MKNDRDATPGAHSVAGRVNSLTGVRILAAGGVFLSHAPRPEFLPEALRTFNAAGYNGVTLFFVLSGFVLAWSYTDRMQTITPRGLWSFFVARFARIYPMYLFALAVIALPVVMSWRGNNVLWLHVFAVQAWSPDMVAAYAYNGPGWSIGVEFFLYACFPLLIHVLAKMRHNTRLMIALAATIIGAAFAITAWFYITGRATLPPSDPESAHRWLYRTPALRLGDFALGILAALIIKNSHAPTWLARTAQTVGGGSILLLMFSPDLLSTAWSWDAAYMLPTTLLIWGLAAGPSTLLARGLSTKPMILFGEASFAFYLLHRPLVGMLGLTPTGGWMWLSMIIIEFSLILLLAIGAHSMIELPAQRWIRRTLDRQPPAAEARPEQLLATPKR